MTKVKAFYGNWDELGEINFDFVDANKKSKWKNIQCNNLSSFDIEVSNGYVNPETGIAEKFDHKKALTNYYEQVVKVSVMYVWQYAIETSCDPDDIIYVFLGRTWEQFKEFTYRLNTIIYLKYLYPQTDFTDEDMIQTLINIHTKCPAITFLTYIHNASYEYQFLRNIWNSEFGKSSGKHKSVFAREKRHPMKFSVKPKGYKTRFEFRDSYVLSGMSLKNWTAGKEISKLEEPADFYEPILTPLSTLSEERQKYSINDVASMIIALKEYKKEYNNIFDIPLTQTGIIRKKCISECQRNLEWIEHCYDVNYTMDYNFYLDLCDIFAGGWTHANSVYSDRLVKDVTCYDLASSYPAIMCMRTLPIGKFELVDPSEYDELLSQDLLDVDLKYHYWLEFEAENVETDIYNTFWSSSKCMKLENPILDNGKIYMADKVRIKMTDLDFDLFRRCYKYENLKIIRMYKAESGYLPKELIRLILISYKNKTELKPADETNPDPVEMAVYSHAKVFCNGIYGCFVYKDFSDDIIFNEDWDKVEHFEEYFNNDYKKHIEKNHYRQWGMYQLGVWVTATGRYNLINTMLQKAGDHLIDEHVCYGDTDSLKGIFTHEDLKVIDDFNDYILGLHEFMSNKYDLPLEMFRPKTKKGKEKPLGIFAPDGEYEEFKTLGAKRYCYKENGKIHTTIAGLKKSCGAKKIEKLGGVKMFNNHLVWYSSESEKLASHYLDKQPHTVWIDDEGQRFESDDKYGICLQPIAFDMSLNDDYDALIAMIASGLDNPLYFENINSFYREHIIEEK